MSGQLKSDGYRLGVDIGGTFTDIVLVAGDGAYWCKKVASTPDDYAQGIVEGLTGLTSEVGLPTNEIDELVHGTTVVINAVLEEKGARTALITTKGFRDVLEFRRLRVPQLYSLHYEPPSPLVPRWLRLEVDERIGAGGATVQPLDEPTAQAVVDTILDAGVESVAVCLLHSFSNPQHERRVGEILEKALPGLFIFFSVDVLPEIREYERTSTTVVNAYLGPVVQRYLVALRRDLEAHGVNAPVRVMHSNGGVMSADYASRNPVKMVESGPAAGVVAAHETAQRLGQPNVITFDMGGTTAKASYIEKGQRAWTSKHEIGAGKHRGGLSHVREVRCLADEGTLQLRSDKRAFLPYGLSGGKPGTPSTNVLNPGSDDRMLPTMGAAPVRRGDLIRHVMASGGGRATLWAATPDGWRQTCATTK